MKNEVEVSIIVPIYNVEKYLQKCIDSILNQTFKNFELILVDDGSPDKCPQIADDYASKYPEIISVIHKKNGGVGEARNFGIESAKGKYILIIDSDDYIEPDMVEAMYENIVKYNSDIAICGFKSVSESGNVISVTKENLQTGKSLALKDNKEILLTNPAPWNKMYKRSLFEENKEIRYPSGVWYEDIRVTLKLLTQAKTITYVDKALLNYLWREGSQTNNKNCNRNVEIIAAFEDIISYYKEKDIFNEYKEELEFLTILHVYITASVRVLMIDTKHNLLNEFREYLYNDFSEWEKNKYINELDKNKKLILKLLNKKQYFLIKAIFTVKNKLKK